MRLPAWARLQRIVLPALVAGVLVALGTRQAVARQSASARRDGFQVGDRIFLNVEGEKALSDTFTVTSGPALVLPTIGSVPLADVPRAAAEKYLGAYIGRFIRNPIVHARALLQVAVSGEVAHPGFFSVPVDALIAEALMSAGGPTKDARMDQIKIDRGGVTLYTPESLRAAIARGATLTDLGLQATDDIIVPARNEERTWRIVGYAVSAALAIVGILAIRR